MGLHRYLYERRYRRGNTRWDTGITPPEVVAVIEGEHPLPPGRALDLGCGTGTNALYLARHGWEVTGVDFSPLAIEAAKGKAEGSGLPVSFRLGDVTRVRELGVEGPFDYVLDIGCFHSVALRRRRAYAREVTALTRPGAVLMVFAWGAGLHVPGFPRTRESEMRRRFGSDFVIERIELGKEPRGAAWFTLQRR